MPMPVPPPPVPPDLFEKRWKEGKRTLRELDPALWEWKEKNRKMRDFQYVCLIGGLALAGITFVICAIVRFL